MPITQERLHNLVLEAEAFEQAFNDLQEQVRKTLQSAQMALIRYNRRPAEVLTSTILMLEAAATQSAPNNANIRVERYHWTKFHRINDKNRAKMARRRIGEEGLKPQEATTEYVPPSIDEIEKAIARIEAEDMAKAALLPEAFTPPVDWMENTVPDLSQPATLEPKE
jgi:hypothetical protein